MTIKDITGILCQSDIDISTIKKIMIEFETIRVTKEAFDVLNDMGFIEYGNSKGYFDPNGRKVVIIDGIHDKRSS